MCKAERTAFVMQPKHLHDNDPWMLAEHIPNCDLFFSTIWMKGFVDTFDTHVGKAYKKILCRYQDYNLWFYFGKDDSYDVGEFLANKFIGEPEFASETNDQIVAHADKLREYSDSIPQTDLHTLSDRQLWEIYDTHYRIHQEYYTWGWMPVCCDMFHGNLTKKVKDYLTGIGVPKETLNQTFVTLTQPTKKSLILIEQEDLLRIAQKMEQGEDIEEDLKAHWQKYYYTKHLWVSGEYTVDDYKRQIQEALSSQKTAGELLRKLNDDFERGKQEKDALMGELGIAGEWRTILQAYGDFMVTKIYRRYAQLLAVHHMSPILREIAKRKFLTEKQIRFVMYSEMEHLIMHDRFDENILRERAKECVYYSERDHEHVFTGESARDLIASLEEDIDTDTQELQGETGCVGQATGKVKIIIRADDMDKMETGDVLVSIATDPDIVPAMKKASAIVTNQGGVTSHAAIVSRELGIPCVIGTKIATKVLKDGDMVEVDADAGIVKKI